MGRVSWKEAADKGEDVGCWLASSWMAVRRWGGVVFGLVSPEICGQDDVLLLSFHEIKTLVFVYPLIQTAVWYCGIKLNPIDFYSALFLSIILFLVSLQI